MVEKKLPSFFKGMRQDKDLREYKKTLEHRGNKIVVRFNVDNKSQLQRLVSIADVYWRDRTNWFKQFREYSVEYLLPVLNSRSRTASGTIPPVSPHRLRRILAVPFSIVFSVDNDEDEVVRFSISGGDNPLLHDRCFEVRGTLEDGLTAGEVVNLF